MLKKIKRGVKKIMKKAEELIETKESFKIDVFNRISGNLENMYCSIASSLKDDTESSRLGFVIIMVGIGLIGKRFIH